MINAKKMDALEFVNSLDGGWDCIVWDYPYMDLKSAQIYNDPRQKKYNRNKNIENHQIYKSYIPESYLLKLKGEILSKVDKCIFLTFFHQPKDFKDFIIWYKEPSRSRTGQNILLNAEFISWEIYNGYTISSNTKDKHIFKVLAIPKKGGSGVTFSKPVQLYIELFEWINPSYVLDPFAGSYNSAKACKELGIKIDTCDKYLDPPSILRKDLYHYGL